MVVTDTSRAGAGADCRIGVALAPDIPYLWFRVKAAAAREFPARYANDPATLAGIDNQLHVVAKRMPMEQLFLPWPGR